MFTRTSAHIVEGEDGDEAAKAESGGEFHFDMKYLLPWQIGFLDPGTNEFVEAKNRDHLPSQIRTRKDSCSWPQIKSLNYDTQQSVANKRSRRFATQKSRHL